MVKKRRKNPEMKLKFFCCKSAIFFHFLPPSSSSSQSTVITRSARPCLQSRTKRPEKYYFSAFLLLPQTWGLIFSARPFPSFLPLSVRRLGPPVRSGRPPDWRRASRKRGRGWLLGDSAGVITVLTLPDVFLSSEQETQMHGTFQGARIIRRASSLLKGGQRSGDF